MRWDKTAWVSKAGHYGLADSSKRRSSRRLSMKHSGSAKSIRMTASLLISVSFPILAVAQSMHASPAAQGFGPAYDAAHEITLNGTIQEVTVRQVSGSPPGTHVLVAGLRDSSTLMRDPF